MKIMLSNKTHQITSSVFEFPILTRADTDGWLHSFDLWETTINDASYIACPQKFGPTQQSDIVTNPKIGHYKNNELFIHWKALIDTEDMDLVHSAYNGRLRACYWRRRYCVYFAGGNNRTWLHSAVLNFIENGNVVHHINSVSIDNRKKNLQIMDKIEHDTIDHPKLDEREIMLTDPDKYWKQRKEQAIQDFIFEISLILNDDEKNNFVGEFARHNLILASDILDIIRMDVNLQRFRYQPSETRILNPHLSDDYLDSYEIEKYLKLTKPKTKNEYQTRLF